MKKDQKIYRITAILFLSLGLLLTFTYRPFIYSNHIYDYGVADTIGTFDYKDIIAAMLSGVIIFIIKTIVDNKIVSKIS